MWLIKNVPVALLFSFSSFCLFHYLPVFVNDGTDKESANCNAYCVPAYMFIVPAYMFISLFVCLLVSCCW